MASPAHTTAPRPIGQLGLHVHLGLTVPPPAVRSYVVAGARRARADADGSEELYPRHYATDGSLIGNLRFAFRHEPLDLGVVHQALLALGPSELAAWVQAEPTGEYSRRAWFLYETLTGQTLDLDNVRAGNYVDALDPRRHYVGAPVNSMRHRVRDNLLGTRWLCPTLRRTERLEAMVQADLTAQAQAITGHYAPEAVARAVSFLYTKETRSSFAIEGEAPSRQREARFLQALEHAGAFVGDKAALIELQRSIVDPRYAADDWRTSQIFVAEASSDFTALVHFIGPRPPDVPQLMAGWETLTQRVLASPLDPVLAAAVSGFAFVFVHPFEDGNGRLHRFLIHHVLAQRGFSPPGIIFPISAAILRHRLAYDQALERFSRPRMTAIDWAWAPDATIVVHNDTLNLYRFFDATAQAEYLYERVAETIEVDLRGELEFLERYDAAYRAVTAVVDMPNQRAGLLVRLLLQHQGRLAKAKRRQFAELTDDEVRRMEAGVQAVLAGDEAATGTV